MLQSLCVDTFRYSSIFIDTLPGVPLQRSEERPVSVHDDEPESVVVGEQRRQRLSVELVVAQVQRRVDRLERLEVDVHLETLTILAILEQYKHTKEA